MSIAKAIIEKPENNVYNVFNRQFICGFNLNTQHTRSIHDSNYFYLDININSVKIINLNSKN